MPKEKKEGEGYKEFFCAYAGAVLMDGAVHLSKFARQLSGRHVAMTLADMLRQAEQAEWGCGCESMIDLVRQFEGAIYEWVVEKKDEAQKKAEELAEEIVKKVKECKLI